jgi:hypothetical protein
MFESRLAFFLWLLFSSLLLQAQVKPEYLYNTGMPYGTLDIRTNVSESNYYYLKEDETFSFRETAPGIKSTTYRDMTDWDSSPYNQGHMRHKNGSTDQFVMNYRLLKPLNYDPSFSPGYPMILMMHGGYERANCYYNDCYHGDWNYDPAENSPPAPTDIASELLNNDHNINLGGRQHIDARNRAGERLPDAPDLDRRAFPGFVIFPQMMNDWDSLSVESAIRVVLLHTRKYNIDLNRIYIHGLSNGGHGVYQVIKRAPWLFSAALPMSSVTDGYIIKQNLQSKIANIPLWIFQGAEDTRPTVATTAALIAKFKEAGASVRYTEYPDIGHAVWNRAYGEDDFFHFMLTKSKSDLHALHGTTAIVAADNIFPTLMLSEGFFAYQWELDGSILEDNTNMLVAKKPGSYRARFSRVANPSTSEWNEWSDPLIITGDADEDDDGDDEGDDEGDDDDGEVITGVEGPTIEDIAVFPNPASSQIKLKIASGLRVEISVVDAMGKVVSNQISEPQSDELRTLVLPASLPEGVYVLVVSNHGTTIRRKVVIRN